MLEAMKTRGRQIGSLQISAARWLAYAGAGAATALTVATPVEAEIHYSGRVDTAFPPDQDKSVAFPLARPGNSISFIHTVNQGMGAAADFFLPKGLKSGAFVGSYPAFEYGYVFRIGRHNPNRYISAGPFVDGLGTMINAGRRSLHWPWHKADAFVGFRFDNGSGKQYGWARVRMDGADSNFSFTVVDYAWADPGESIKPGQTSNVAGAHATTEGSLGLLAIGAAGLATWRQGRRRRCA